MIGEQVWLMYSGLLLLLSSDSKQLIQVAALFLNVTRRHSCHRHKWNTCITLQFGHLSDEWRDELSLGTCLHLWVQWEWEWSLPTIMSGCVKLFQVLTGCNWSGCCLNAVIGQSKANSFTALANKCQIHEITVLSSLEMTYLALLDHNCWVCQVSVSTPSIGCACRMYQWHLFVQSSHLQRLRMFKLCIGWLKWPSPLPSPQLMCHTPLTADCANLAHQNLHTGAHQNLPSSFSKR